MATYRYYKTRLIHFLKKNNLNPFYIIISILILIFLILIFNFNKSINQSSNDISNSYSKNKLQLTSFYTKWLTDDESNKNKLKQSQLIEDDLKIQKIQLFKSIFKNIELNKPLIKIENLEFKSNDNNEFNIYNEINLMEFMKFSDEFINSIKSSHLNYLKNLPDFNSNILNYKGNGVIILGGGDLTWLSLLTTRMFRRMGGELPVQVILPKMSDYYKDREICDKFLSQLDAKCVVITEKLGINEGNEEDLFFQDFQINSSMYKSLSILVSDFENVLYLESNNLLLKPIDNNIFNNNFFKSQGELVIWPDFFKRKTSPLLYSALDVKIGNERIRDLSFILPLTSQLKSSKSSKVFSFHDRKNSLPDPSSDGSQILINKKTHWKTLLLTLYYNLYGYNYFYPLITQSNQNGEKETFALASLVLNLPFYQVKHNTEAVGFWYNDEFRGVGLLQFDPLVDFYTYNSFIEKYSDSNPQRMNNNDFQNYIKSSNERESALFFNVNFPPLYPIELFKEKFVVKENGDRLKLFGNDFKYSREENFELTIWKIIKDYICSYDLKCSYLNKFSKDQFNRNDFCSIDLENHLSWLNGGN